MAKIVNIPFCTFLSYQSGGHNDYYHIDCNLGCVCVCRMITILIHVVCNNFNYTNLVVRAI